MTDLQQLVDRADVTDVVMALALFLDRRGGDPPGFTHLTSLSGGRRVSRRRCGAGTHQCRPREAQSERNITSLACRSRSTETRRTFRRTNSCSSSKFDRSRTVCPASTSSTDWQAAPRRLAPHGSRHRPRVAHRRPARLIPPARSTHGEGLEAAERRLGAVST